MNETFSVIRSQPQPLPITRVNEILSDKGIYKDFCVSSIINPRTIFCSLMSSSMGATAGLAFTKAFGFSIGIAAGFGVSSGIAAVCTAKPIISGCCGTDTSTQIECNTVNDDSDSNTTETDCMISNNTSVFLYETTV
jgi:hypothetical protein